MTNSTEVFAAKIDVDSIWEQI